MRRSLFSAFAVALIVLTAFLLWQSLRRSAPTPRSFTASSVSGSPMTEPARAFVIEGRIPSGKLRLEGQVIDEEQRPVGNAFVTLASIPHRVARTEKDGSFAFEGLLPRTYRLEARNSMQAADPVEAQLTATSDPVVLVLRDSPVVEVIILDANDRRPLAFARVEVEEQPGLSVATDGAGKAVLAGLARGRYTLRASAEGHVAAHQPVFQHKGSARIPVLFLLAAGAPVFGRTIDASGVAVVGARVRAVSTSALLPTEADQIEEATSDAEGHWRLLALPMGTFRFAAVHAEHAPVLSEPVALNGKVPHGPVVLTLGRGARLSGRVVEKSGAAAAFADVDVRTGTAGPVRLQRRAITDAQGAFELAGLPFARVQVSARAEIATSVAQYVDLSAGAASVTLVLDADGVIAGTVIAPDGSPAAMAQVVAVPDSSDTVQTLTDSKNGHYASDVTDQRGGFRLHGLARGAYRVRASLTHSVQSTAFWLSPGVSARTGDSEVRIQLEVGGSLFGTVELHSGGAPATFTVALTLSAPQLFSGGHFTLADVPPGTHTITLIAPGYAPKRIEGVRVHLGEKKDLGRIELDAGRTLSGHVFGPDGPAAGATVLAGAQILGDGTQIGGALLRATADNAGRFELSGAPDEPLTVVAEHPTIGRSTPQLVPLGPLAIPLDLRLRALAGLAGLVTQTGKPAPQAIVVAAPRGSAGATGRFLVPAQSDGRYRFDRLSAGEYLITAVLRADSQQLHHSLAVTLEEAHDAQVDINVQEGTEQLDVRLVQADGRPLQNAQVYLTTGSVAATSLGQLESELAARGPGQTRIGLSWLGRPVLFTGLFDGPHTLCAIPIRDNLGDPAVVQWIRDHAPQLSATCISIAVESGVPNQQALLKVD